VEEKMSGFDNDYREEHEIEELSVYERFSQALKEVDWLEDSEKDVIMLIVDNARILRGKGAGYSLGIMDSIKEGK
jgi:hypothetical protein